MASSRRIPRKELLELICCRILEIEQAHPVRVGVDGVDAAGKSSLADELAAALANAGRPIVRASGDAFHRPRHVRYRRGRESAEGYYQDAFDYASLRTCLLDPLGPAGHRRFRTAIFDYQHNEDIESAIQTAHDDTILLLDGVFLQRPEIAAAWDFLIFLRIQPETAIARALARDIAPPGGAATVRRLYERRYLPAHQHYEVVVGASGNADVLVDNDEPAWPQVTLGRGSFPES